MAANFDMAVTYFWKCRRCRRVHQRSYQTAGYRPSDVARYLKDEGWSYSNMDGWTCPVCIGADKRLAAARLRGLRKRLQNALDEADQWGRKAQGASSPWPAQARDKALAQAHTIQAMIDKYS